MKRVRTSILVKINQLVKTIYYWFVRSRNFIIDSVLPQKNTVLIFDTSLYSDNKGDEIINIYCKKILKEIFIDAEFIDVPTHRFPNEMEMTRIRKNKRRLVCGTNLLSPDFSSWCLWHIPHSMVGYHNIITLGVGWGYYSDGFTNATRDIYRCILSSKGIHSVRDAYTENKMNEMGIKNVILTGCPTLWNLTTELCEKIPKIKSDIVVTTLTDYARNPRLDKVLLDMLGCMYKTVYLWPQGSRDLEYLREIDTNSSIQVLEGGVNEYSRFLQENNTDYVGTRLHAGIHALNYAKRTIIISVDNRAIEMKKSFNLPVVNREQIDSELNNLITKEYDINLSLPWENIEKWKKQFID